MWRLNRDENTQVSLAPVQNETELKPKETKGNQSQAPQGEAAVCCRRNSHYNPLILLKLM